MNLALAISSLGPGGAERVLVRLAGHWAGAGHQVTIVTLAGGETPPFYPLPEGVALRPLGVSGATRGPLAKLAALRRRVLALRRALREIAPDAAIAFLDTTNILTLLAARPLRIPVLACERIDPGAHAVGRFWSLLRARTYPRAAAVAVQTRGALQGLPAGARSRAVVIPNSVAPAGTGNGRPEHAAPPPLLLAVGRLDRQKGHDILLNAFARVAGEHADWSLLILGEGPERGNLEALRDRLGLTDRVRLPGLATDMAAQYRAADAFVLPSRYEGFPNALCEAMAHGLPCTAFDCPSGPGEIIHHEEDGLLVPPGDADALALALDRLLGDAALRARLAAKAPEVAQRFSEERVFALWDRLLAEVADRSI